MHYSGVHRLGCQIGCHIVWCLEVVIRPGAFRPSDDPIRGAIGINASKTPAITNRKRLYGRGGRDSLLSRKLCPHVARSFCQCNIARLSVPSGTETRTSNERVASSVESNRASTYSDQEP